MGRVWLPPSARRPVHRCLICGKEYRSPERQAKHVARCAREHAEVLESTSPRTIAEKLLGDAERDREEFVERNRQAILEGRKSLYHDGEKWLPDR